MSLFAVESYICHSPTHINIPDLSYRQLKALVLFQDIYKLRRQTAHSLNKTLNIIYRTLVSISNNLNNNYVLNVVSVEQYKKYMEKTEALVVLLSEIPRPLSIKHISCIKDLKSKVLYLHYQISELVKLCGASQCYDVFKIFAGEDWELSVNSKNLKLLELYNTMFVPVTVKTTNINEKFKVIKYTAFTLSVMLKIHGAEITVPLNGNSIIIKGYFRDDPLNIARIGGSLESKHKDLITMSLDVFKDYNKEIVSKYIEQLPLRDFISLDNLSLINGITMDLKEFQKLKTLPKGHIVEEFFKSNVKKQITILTLLLLDPQLKDHVLAIVTNCIDKSAFSEVYKILHWSIQKQFDKITRDIDKDSITSLNRELLPYETRIENMKCTDVIKRKAKEKLKEIKSSREGNEKAVKYLDGLLNMPFGVYRKEKIIKFVTEFVNSVKTVKNDLKDYLKDNSNEILNEFLEVLNIELEKENEINKTILKVKKLNDTIRSDFNDVLKPFKSQIENLIHSWNGFKIDRKDYLLNIKDGLEQSIYGQDEAKRKIETVLAQWINGEMSGAVFGFQGYPGTGKTSLAKHGIANSIKDQDGNTRPFFFISLGGAKSGSYLLGHNYTYVGSQFGKIAECLQSAKIMNPILYFDELDKVSDSACGEEIIRILTHLTDPEQNEHIEDKYFGVEMDLSKALIIFSYNNSSKIDEVLLDRIHEVNFRQYNKRDKVQISCKYILPKLFKNMGYSNDSIIFKDEILEYLIENYTNEAGVRDMKDKLLEIIREINLRRIYNEELYALPYNITEEFVDEILKRKNKTSITEIPPKAQVGWVNGLYATSIGTGGITVIQVFNTPSDQKYHLEITGKLGDVMKESIKCAKTISWGIYSESEKIKVNEFWRSNALHVHFPAAGTSKDGPSAGAAITTAIISYFSNLPVRNYIAMTGEIDLYGNVRAIGGLQCKIEGAQRAGVKIVLIPRENEAEYLDFAKDYKISVFPVDNISQVIKTCLIGADTAGFKYSHDVNDKTTQDILKTIESLEYDV